MMTKSAAVANRLKMNLTKQIAAAVDNKYESKIETETEK